MKAKHVGIATVIGTAALYFLLAGVVSSGETIACLIVLLIACSYAIAVSRTGTVPMRLSLQGIWTLLKAFGAVLPELWHVGSALLQALRRRPERMLGVVKQVPFRFGAFTAGDVGRRAAVVTAMSLAPNGFVVGMAHDRDELILHQLRDEPVGGDREWPL